MAQNFIYIPGAGFLTIVPTAGTDPSALTGSTLTFTSTDGSVVITGNASTNTLNFHAAGGGGGGWTVSGSTIFPTVTSDRVLIGGATDDGSSSLNVAGLATFSNSLVIFANGGGTGNEVLQDNSGGYTWEIYGNGAAAFGYDTVYIGENVSGTGGLAIGDNGPLGTWAINGDGSGYLSQSGINFDSVGNLRIVSLNSDAGQITSDGSGNLTLTQSLTANMATIGSGGLTTTSLVASAPIYSNVGATVVNGSTSGNAHFLMPLQGSSLKKIIVHCSSLTGTASYTFPTAFSNTPAILTTNSLASSLVTSISTTAMTVTGSNSTGTLILEGY